MKRKTGIRHYGQMIALNAKTLAEERARKATQEDLAGQLGIKIGYISAAENHKPIPERAAEAIAKALGKSTLILFKPITNALTYKRIRKTRLGSSSEIGSRFAHADPEVVFWHTFRDRDADGSGVGNLIAKSERQVIISGATLHQLVLRFDNDIVSALEQRVLVGIIRARLTPELCKLYDPYGRFDTASISNSNALYEKLRNRLSDSQKKYFGLFETDQLLTHSIGLYDKRLFVAEFVMHQHSELSPSYMVPSGSPTHQVLLSELIHLLRKSRLVCGGAQMALIKNAAREKA